MATTLLEPKINYPENKASRQGEIPIAVQSDLKSAVKPAASLNAGLLARKGEARPSLSQETKVLADAGVFDVPRSNKHDKVTSNKGSENYRARSGQSGHIGHSEQAKQARQPGESAREPMVAAPRTQQEGCDSAPADPLLGMARVSFRMSMAEFLRLKMAGVMLERPCKEILLEALTLYLDQQSVSNLNDCQCFDAVETRAMEE